MDVSSYIPEEKDDCLANGYPQNENEGTTIHSEKDGTAVPPIELRITVSHTTRDMSVAGYYANDVFVCFKELKERELIDLEKLDCGSVRILSVSEDVIVLQWREDEYTVPIGKEASSESIKLDNPYLSLDLLKLTFRYRKIPDYDELIDMIVAISEEDLQEEDGSHNADRKKDVIYFTDKVIAGGHLDLYPLKALLEASRNWGTCEIVFQNIFCRILSEAIDKGCLATDDAAAWNWMDIASMYNDLSFLQSRIEGWETFLNNAAEQGNTVAQNLLNSMELD